jgi:hypothetical protein
VANDTVEVSGTVVEAGVGVAVAVGVYVGAAEAVDVGAADAVDVGAAEAVAVGAAVGAADEPPPPPPPQFAIRTADENSRPNPARRVARESSITVDGPPKYMVLASGQ